MLPPLTFYVDQAMHLLSIKLIDLLSGKILKT